MRLVDDEGLAKGEADLASGNGTAAATGRRWWKLWGLVGAVLVVLLGYAAAGPFLCVRGVNDAIRNRNTGELASNVDFDALRASFKSQLSGAMMNEVNKDTNDGFGKIGAELGGIFIDHIVEQMVTPEGIIQIIRSSSHAEAPPPDVGQTAAPPPSSSEPKPAIDRAKIKHWGFTGPSTFVIELDSPKVPGKSIFFVIHRYGLGWKLADIRLPVPAGSDTPVT